MWDLPGPGLELVSPALAGRFLTTVPPRKPCYPLFTEQETEAQRVKYLAMIAELGFEPRHCSSKGLTTETALFSGARVLSESLE